VDDRVFVEPCPFCPAEFVASDPLGAETMLGHHVLIGHRGSQGGFGSPGADTQRVRAPQVDPTPPGGRGPAA